MSGDHNMKDSFECPRCGHCCAVDEWADVNHPKHYTSHPSGIECIEITEHMNFNLGNAMKYVWRASLKGKEVEDLKKAIWYLEREIARIG